MSASRPNSNLQGKGIHTQWSLEIIFKKSGNKINKCTNTSEKGNE